MIRQETHEGVSIITLDFPPVNALAIPVLDALDETFEQLENTGSRAVVLTGAGRCFSAGLDLNEIRSLDRAGRERLVEALNRCFERLYRFPRPVVAAVNGHAVAGGMVLLLAADNRLCADARIKIGLAEVRVGIPFPMGALAIVQNELDPAGLRQFAALGFNVDPHEALRLRVVDEVVPPDKLLSRALEIARDVASLPDNAFRAVKLHLRGAAADRIRQVRQTGKDPVFDAWDDDLPA
jgi:enoyl-CoA hydratase